jgi:hypothetical protein
MARGKGPKLERLGILPRPSKSIHATIDRSARSVLKRVMTSSMILLLAIGVPAALSSIAFLCAWLLTRRDERRWRKRQASYVRWPGFDDIDKT